MEQNLINRGVGFFWKILRLNALFAISNAVLIYALLAVVLHPLTLPIYLLGVLLAVPSLQALFLAIRRFEELEKTSPTELYFRCYRQEWSGAIFYALGYILAIAVLFGSFFAQQFMPFRFGLEPVYTVLVILLYVHLIFGLLVRSYFHISIAATWRLGLYCISKYPMTALFIFAGSLLAGALVGMVHQLILLGIIPALVYLLTISTERIISDLRGIVTFSDSEEEKTNVDSKPNS